jgi:hypothetical protein
MPPVLSVISIVIISNVIISKVVISNVITSIVVVSPGVIIVKINQIQSALGPFQFSPLNWQT